MVDSINNSIVAFRLELGKEDKDSLGKVTRLSNIVQDLRQQVEELYVSFSTFKLALCKDLFTERITSTAIT